MLKKLERGYPDNLYDLVTSNLNTDYTATRMRQEQFAPVILLMCMV